MYEHLFFVSITEAMNSLMLLMAIVGGQTDTIDAMAYSDDADARATWTANEGTPPVLAYDGAAGRALRVAAPFAANRQRRRAVIDREVKLNLSAPTMRESHEYYVQSYDVELGRCPAEVIQ
jgi:hypothetical protein